MTQKEALPFDTIAVKLNEFKGFIFLSVYNSNQEKVGQKKKQLVVLNPTLYPGRRAGPLG